MRERGNTKDIRHEAQGTRGKTKGTRHEYDSGGLDTRFVRFKNE